MRLVVEMQTNFLPAVYRNRIMSLIKHALMKQDEEYYKQFYQEKRPKPFTFGIIVNNYEKKKDVLQINDKYMCNTTIFVPKNNEEYLHFSLIVSSNDYIFLHTLMAGLRQIKTFEFSKDNYMLVNNEKSILHINHIFIPFANKIENPEITFKTNTPIVVMSKEENKEKREFLFPDNPKFNDTLNDIMNTKLRNIRGFGLRNEIALVPINTNIVRIPHYISDKLISVQGSEGKFSMIGHPKDLEDCYYMGIGLRTAQGFGMVTLC